MSLDALGWRLDLPRGTARTSCFVQSLHDGAAGLAGTPGAVAHTMAVGDSSLRAAVRDPLSPEAAELVLERVRRRRQLASAALTLVSVLAALAAAAAVMHIVRALRF